MSVAEANKPFRVKVSYQVQLDLLNNQDLERTMEVIKAHALNIMVDKDTWAQIMLQSIKFLQLV